MIWVKHDFYDNFTKSNDTNDIELMLDIFRSEITDLLTYNSDILFKLFDKVSIKYNKKGSYEELFDIVMKNVKENPKFVNGLSFLIAENTKTIKEKADKGWIQVLNKITKGIKKIADYFKENPRQQKLFKIRTLEMLGTKSSITGDDDRELNKKDNTLYWILGIVAVGVVGYFVYRYFDQKKQDRLRAESLKPSEGLGELKDINIETPNPKNINVPNQPIVTQKVSNVNMQEPILDPDYFVPPDVLIPNRPMPAPNYNMGGNVGNNMANVGAMNMGMSQNMNVQQNFVPNQNIMPNINNQPMGVNI